MRFGQARHLSGLVAEFAFIVGALFATMTAALVVVGGVNPLSSGFMIGIFVVVTFSALIHHLWYSRHRAEIEAGMEHHADRERRGY
jgi:hypothetical protein